MRGWRLSTQILTLVMSGLNSFRSASRGLLLSTGCTCVHRDLIKASAHTCPVWLGPRQRGAPCHTRVIVHGHLHVRMAQTCCILVGHISLAGTSFPSKHSYICRDRNNPSTHIHTYPMGLSGTEWGGNRCHSLDKPQNPFGSQLPWKSSAQVSREYKESRSFVQEPSLRVTKTAED